VRRSLHTLAERLEKDGFEGDYLFTEDSLRMLGEDTTGLREREREIVEAWHRSQGRDRAAEAEDMDLENEAQRAKQKLRSVDRTQP
jgi:hypothetical protein